MYILPKTMKNITFLIITTIIKLVQPSKVANILVHPGETFTIKCAILEENKDHSCHIVTPHNATIIPIVNHLPGLENNSLVWNGVLYGESRISSISNLSQCGVEVKNASIKDIGLWFCMVTSHGKDGGLKTENTVNIHLRLLDSEGVKTIHSKNKNLGNAGNVNDNSSKGLLVNSNDRKGADISISDLLQTEHIELNTSTPTGLTNIDDTLDNKERIEVNNTYLNIRGRNYTQISEKNNKTLSNHTKKCPSWYSNININVITVMICICLMIIITFLLICK